MCVLFFHAPATVATGQAITLKPETGIAKATYRHDYLRKLG